MSVVTDIMVITAAGEYVGEIQKWFASHKKAGLREITEGAGGGKAMQCEIWAGAYNYFDTPEFLTFLQTQTWEMPECMMVMTKEENDDQFTIGKGK